MENKKDDGSVKNEINGMPRLRERWLVTGRDGTLHLAEVVDTRKAEGGVGGGGGGGNGGGKSGGQYADKNGDGGGGSSRPEQPYFYVHYINFDRRMDEWVSLDRFKIDAGPQHIEPAANLGDKRRVTTRMKRKYDEIGSNGGHGAGDKEGLDPALAVLEREHEEITKVKNIQKVLIGKHEVETWYFSPYPDDYSKVDKLHVCEFCLKYMLKEATLTRHRTKCILRHPPGNEIYRETAEGGHGCGLSVFEVDGRTNKIYCQNLCLLAKLFLDHKTLYYDVDPFMFFVLCEVDDEGAHIVGYFSKEKCSPEEYNLACILTFPPYQRKGYGKLLISLSYEISRRENRVGSPEKPLSDLGKVSYRSYWTYILMKLLLDHEGDLNIRVMSAETAIKSEDIISTLQSLNMIKYWKGQHVIAANRAIISEALAKTSRIKLCKPDCLSWPVRLKEEAPTVS